MSHATLSPAPGWCLRFLSGAIRGRTILLAPGTNRVGSGPDSQILLPASDAQALHLVFTVGDVALSVQRIGEAAAAINGVPMPVTRRSVVVGDVVSIGTIDFQIERNYPVNEQARDSRESMFLDGDAELLASDTTLAAPATPRSTWRTWAVAAGVWVVTMAAAWWGLAGNASEGRPGAGLVDLAAIESVLKDFPETDAVVSGAGQVTVTGFVESQARRARLNQSMQPFGQRLVVRVHAVDELIDQARRFVSDPGLAVTYEGKGLIAVSGRTERADVQDKVLRLRDDLHPAVRVTDKVQYKPKPVEAAMEARDQWAAWQKVLPSRMVSITDDGQGLRYIQLANGNVYFEGAVLKSGDELANLSPDRAAAADTAASAPGAVEAPR